MILLIKSIDIFGNAYFHHAFTAKTQYEDLQKAVNCYVQAEKNQSKFKNPDIYYNRAMVYLYLEDINKAIIDLQITETIDQSLKAGALAESVSENMTILMKQIKNQCGIKYKNLAKILATIPTNVNEKSGYQLIDVENNFGKHEKKMLSVKVIQQAMKNVDIPISLICSDHKGFFFMVSIYNISKEFNSQIKPKISNLTIIDPEIVKTKCNIKGKDYEFVTVKVIDLSKFLLDGNLCAYYTSSSELSSTFFT